LPTLFSAGPSAHPDCVTLYVIHTLHKIVKEGRAIAWPFQATSHFAIQDLEKFVFKHGLGHVEYGSTPLTRTMKIEIWDLDKFTGFDAYGSGEHYGNMWTNHNGNPVGVVAPLVLLFKQKYKTAKTPVQTTMQGRVNTMRWNGKEIVLDSAFTGRKNTGPKGKPNKMRTLTVNHIWRSKTDGVTEDVRKIRESAWKLTGRLHCLANLAGLTRTTSPDADPELISAAEDMATRTNKVRVYLGELCTELDALRLRVPCNCSCCCVGDA
jgi:hypothetical protein